MTFSDPHGVAPDPIPTGVVVHGPTVPIVDLPTPVPITVIPPAPSASAADLQALRDQVAAWMTAAEQQIHDLVTTVNSLQNSLYSVGQGFIKHTHPVQYGVMRLPQMNWDGTVDPPVPGQPPGLPFMIAEDESGRTSGPKV